MGDNGNQDEKQASGSNPLPDIISSDKGKEGNIVTTVAAASRSPSVTLRTTATPERVLGKLRRVGLFVGIVNDIRSRAPYYTSDWTDAWNYRTIPAIVLIFFAK